MIMEVSKDMDLRSLLNDRKMTMYRLAQLSGIPKTTIVDICSGKTSIECCSARTVLRIAKTLGCTMEELLKRDDEDCGI